MQYGPSPPHMLAKKRKSFQRSVDQSPKLWVSKTITQTIMKRKEAEEEEAWKMSI